VDSQLSPVLSMNAQATFTAVLFSALVWAAPVLSADAKPPIESASAWNDLKPSAGEAFRADSQVLIALDDVPQELRIPRLFNRMTAAYWLGDDAKTPLVLRPEPTEWVLRLDIAPPAGRDPVVVLELEDEPRLQADVIRPVDGVIELPAHQAQTHGENLRYEPPPHKNTVGYWTNADDWAEWQFAVDEPGECQVQIQQGCGTGQGGSEVDLVINAVEGGPAGATVSFKVIETGHFQSFLWCDLATVRLPRAGRYRLEVRPRKLANRAVMDVRTVRLRPVGEAAPAQAQKRPNVLFLITDDQGTLDAGCYGSRDLFTPYLDGLASRGVRFTQTYAHTVCCPARAMLMTGRYPQRGGVNSWMQRMLYEENGLNMDSDEVTLAEVLREYGYRTALFGKWHLGAAIEHGPTRQGFDEFFGLRDGFIDNYNHFHLHREGFHDLYRGIEEVWHPGEYFPELMTTAAEQYLDQHVAQHAGRPFFLYVGFNLPHYPEQSAAKFDQFYARHEMPRQSYGKVISTVDDLVGRVLAKLDEHGLRDDTIVVCMSDNGHSAESYTIGSDNHSSGYPRGHDYGAHGGGANTGKWIGHKGTFYEGGLRVPAFVSYPRRLPTGVVRDQAVTAMDWYPTVLDLCDIDPPAPLDGHSVLPVIEQDAPSKYGVMHWHWQNHWCVRDGDWKLISDRDGLKLVSLADDEPERADHAGEHPDLVQRLRSLHEAWLTEVNQD